MAETYVTRAVDGLLDELLVSFSAVSLVGPRAAGKTTTAGRRAATVLRLDRPNVQAAVAADPDAMLLGLPEPVVIDEWQEVPDVLGAVKRAVDDDPRPGRFILTGSVRAELENRVWPGTGRILQVPMYGLSVRERRGLVGDVTLLDRIATDGVSAVRAPTHEINIRGYLDVMLEGSFPEPALRTPPAARGRSFDGYIEQMITRDVPARSELPQPSPLQTLGISPGCGMRPVTRSPPESSCTPDRTSSRLAIV